MKGWPGAPAATLAQHRGDGAGGTGGHLQYRSDEVETQPEVLIGEAACGGYRGAGAVHQGIGQRVGDTDGDIFMFGFGSGEGKGHRLHGELR